MLTRQFGDVLRSFGLKWAVNSPTRVTATSSTAIDNAVTNIPNITVNVLNTALSDHDAQEIIIRGCVGRDRPHAAMSKRNCCKSNINTLNKFLEKENWDYLHELNSVDDIFNAFSNSFVYFLNLCCPFKNYKSGNGSSRGNWITQEILATRERLRFYSEILRSRNDANTRQHYNNLRKKYRKDIKFAKSLHFSKQLENSNNISKDAWKIIRSTNHATLKKSINLNVNGQIISDPLSVATAFNQYFTSVANSGGGRCTLQTDFDLRCDGLPSSMFLRPVCRSEVESVIRSLSSTKTVDVDGISAWLVKDCLKNIVDPLTTIINSSFINGAFPSALKIAKVIPIFKKDDNCLANNYRPISILPIFSKIIEKVFLIRLLKFFEDHKVFSDNQFGFRSGKSTVDAVTQLIEFVIEGMEDREHTLAVFLDLSKAFDCVDHDILLQKLWNCGVRGLPHKWLQSYLSDRGQCVQVENSVSNHMKTHQGVPQGSILGPVLFLIYVNDLESSIKDGRIIQYADDTTLCFRAATQQELEIKAFINLNTCIQRFLSDNLKTNSSKTNVLQFSLRYRDGGEGAVVMVDDDILKEVDSTKFLGIHLDKGLTWNDHINSVCLKVSKGIFALRRLASYCSQKVLLMAYYGLVFPHMSYGIALWGSSATIHFDRIFKLQKKAVRIISKLKYRESCKNTFRDLQILTLPSLYILETAMYCRFKCTLTSGSDVHGYETRGRAAYRIDQHRTVAFQRLPSQAGVKIINALPEDIKNEITPHLFKARLKRHLVSFAFYSVGEFLAHIGELGVDG